MWFAAGRRVVNKPEYHSSHKQHDQLDRGIVDQPTIQEEKERAGVVRSNESQRKENDARERALSALRRSKSKEKLDAHAKASGRSAEEAILREKAMKALGIAKLNKAKKAESNS